MAANQDSYVGFSEETPGSYGTGVAVTRFYEYISENLVGSYERIESAATGRGQRVLRADRFAPNPKGAAGTFTTEALDHNLGLLLKHCFGAVATTTVGGNKCHTFTPADLRGLSLTAQVGRVDVAGNINPFTYEGCKVPSWTLSNQLDGVLQLAVDLDAAKETPGAGSGIYAAAAPTYVDGLLLTFRGGVVQIAGTDFGVNNITLKGDNGLNTGRWVAVTGGNKKREPLEEGLRSYTFDLAGEFESMTHYNRIASATVAGALGTITLNWASPTSPLGLAVTIQNARFDTGPVSDDGAKTIPQELSGVCLKDDSHAAVTAAYTTPDVTP